MNNITLALACVLCADVTAMSVL